MYAGLIDKIISGGTQGCIWTSIFSPLPPSGIC